MDCGKKIIYGLLFKIYSGCPVFTGSNVYSNLVVEIAFVVVLDVQLHQLGIFRIKSLI
jgi:hypothetical protein